MLVMMAKVLSTWLTGGVINDMRYQVLWAVIDKGALTEYLVWEVAVE